MPKAIVYVHRGNQPKTSNIMEPVAAGLRKIGWYVAVREGSEYPRGDESDYDLGAAWGDTGGTLRILSDCGRTFPQVLHVDNGYLRRERYVGYYGLSYGGRRQCYDYFWNLPPYPDRWLTLNETIKPWRNDGEEILLLVPSTKQGKILGFDVDQWARQVLHQITAITRRRVVVSMKRFAFNEPLREQLQKNSFFTAVGYNTKGLIECALEGIPIFTLAPCAAMHIAAHGDLNLLNTPYYPDNRLDFFERLAGTQYLLREITEGVPFTGNQFPLKENL